MKIKKVKGYVFFQDEVLLLEELGGLNTEMIFFNPERINGICDYKIQLTEMVFLREKGSMELINILDMKDQFEIINSEGKIIATSTDLNPEFVDSMLHFMENSYLKTELENKN